MTFELMKSTTGPNFTSMQLINFDYDLTTFLKQHFFQESHKGQVMSSADWKLDSAELESLFNPKTKAIIFNNPNNPLGKVFTRPEIEEIANLCKKHNVLMISDDVYEHMV